MDLSRRSFLKKLGIGGVALAAGIPLIGKSGVASVLKDGKTPKEIDEGKYFFVRFHPKVYVDDSEAVFLGVNGKVLAIKRNVPVVIHQRYLKVANHAYSFTTGNGIPLRSQSKVTMYPYDILGEATYKDYIKQRVNNAKK